MAISPEAGGPAHQALFEDFVALAEKQAATYAFVNTTLRAAQGLPFAEKVKVYGISAAFYDGCISALVGCHGNPWPPSEAWLAEHWEDIKPFKRERRTVNKPYKMVECLSSLDQWLLDFPARLDRMQAAATLGATIDEDKLYQAIRADVRRVKHFGRYISIRMTEALVQGLGLAAFSDSIFAKDGKYVRGSLSLFYPEHRAALLPEEEDAWQLAEALGAHQRERLFQNRGLVVTPSYQSAMLCEYRVLINGRYYVGMSLDEELRSLKRVQEAGGDISPFLEARSRIPECYLGEAQGWEWTIRKPLRTYARDHGRIWDDAQQSYLKKDYLR